MAFMTTYDYLALIAYIVIIIFVGIWVSNFFEFIFFQYLR